MSLTKYKNKRRFDKTPEPAARSAKAKNGRRLKFVIQEHAASRLHYDFRLELGGVLKSWAVPKGPSLDPSEKRLAVEVEDHPLEYAKFEGTIPAGQYGAGEVIVWDRGHWTPVGEARAGLKLGKLEFDLQGQKLKGRWVLVRLRGRERSNKNNWLLIKKHDEFSRPLAEYDVLADQPQSVKTGRKLAELKPSLASEPGTKPRARRNRTIKTRATKKRAAKKRAPPAGSIKAPLPKTIDVQLATLAAAVPEAQPWIHEIKFDGYRLIARLADGKATLITRRHQDWTHRYPSIVKAVADLPAESAILDGELVALLPTGVSSFQALQNAGKNGHAAPLVYYAFDLLYLDGYDLRRLPLEKRKDQLRKLLDENHSSAIQYSDHVKENGAALFREAARRGLEGLISKRRDRPYRPGRGSDWLKIKALGREELVVGGFTLSTADRRGIGALLVGYFEREQLTYAGRVGTGFSSQMLLDLRQRLEKLKIDRCPFAQVPAKERGPMVKWVRPELVAEIQFGEWTAEGILRHPSFQGLREDKAAADVTRPASLQIASEDQPMPRAKTGRRRATKAEPLELPVCLTHPERVLYPDTGLTKLGLAQFYASIAPWILPHVIDRPLSLLRCPEGYPTGKCFFQKHARPGTPQNLGRITIEERSGKADYVYVRDLSSLLSLVQMSILEIHPWGARRDNIERPDRLTFDLDPGPDVPWKRVIEAARAVRELLDSEYSLTSFVKTTGGKGLHVVVPLAPRRYAWDKVKAFCHGVATHLAQAAPKQYTTNMAKAARQGRIFVDYLRNDRGATAVCAYSTRARPGAPVSTPLAWDELSTAIRSDHFNVSNLPARLSALARDPWAGIATMQQGLP